MIGSKPNALVALSVALSHLGAVVVASEIPTPGRGRTGILRVGELRSREQERAYPLVEKRLQRWLENQTTFSARAELLSGSVSSEVLQSQDERRRLESALGALETALLDGAPEPSLRAPAKDLVSRPELLRGLGPVAQRALLLEATALLAEKADAAAKELLRAAVALHPDGRATSPFSWERAAETPRLARLEATLEATVAAMPRQCRVDVAGLAPAAELFVNGFSVGPRRELLLAVPFVYRLQAEGRHVETRCERPGQRTVRLPATAPLPLAGTALSEISARRGMRSLVLVEPREDEFRLYLYAVDRAGDAAVREIPLKAPLLVAEVLDAPSESTLPIASDAFADLFGRSPGLAVERGPDAAELRLKAPPADAPRWYNSATFWLVVGGVAAGVATAVLLSRGDSQVRTQPGFTVRIE